MASLSGYGHKLLGAICGLALLAQAAAAQEAARPAGTVEPAVQGQELQRVEERRRVLFAQILADPANLDVAFEYAALSARAGDLEAAISTLERMLIFAPGLPRLQLELGVLYFRLGAFEIARVYFENALATPNVPEAVKTRVNTYLVAIDKGSAGERFSGVILAGVRYQTNATAAPDSRIVSTVFGDLLLNQASLGQEDFNAFTTGSFNYSVDLENQGDRFEANLLTYGAAYRDSSEINTALAELSFGPIFDLERFEIEDTSLGLYAILSGVLLEQDPYLGSAGAGASVVRLLNPRTRWTSRFEYRREQFQDSSRRPTASDRTGDRLRSQNRLQFQVSERFGIFAALESERRFAERDYLSLWELAGSAGWSLSFDSPVPKQRQRWSLSVSGGYAERFYDEPDPVFSFTEEEHDEEAFVQGSLTVPFSDSWAVQAQGGYRVVESNYDLREFDNLHGSLAVLTRF